jgi:hypothetical protein
MSSADKNIDWDEVIKKEARGINDDADFGEVQLTMGDQLLQKKVSQIKKDFTCQNTL